MKQIKTTNKDSKDLYEAVLELQSVDECKKFFRDLCTLSETNAMVERFKVVKMVDEGVPYREISKIVGSSTATVTRVAHWLHHGKGGYKLVLERLK
jgi:TrpR-related protein YerC/YecD